MLFRVLLGIDLALLALIFLSDAAVTLYIRGHPDGDLARQVSAAAAASDRSSGLLQSALLVLFGGGLLPAVFLAFSRNKPWPGVVRALRLHRPGPSIALGIGMGVAVLFALGIVISIGLSVYAQLTHQDLKAVQDQNTSQAAQDLIRLTPLPLALLLSLSAGVGEEVLFRGLLQRWFSRFGSWTGVVVPAGLFGLLHYGYGTPLQILGPMLLGLVFGFLILRGFSLWVTIAAHATFDFAVFVIQRLFGDLGF